MPIKGFLKIPDIAGESTAAQHEDEIDVHSVDWSVEQRNSSSVGRRRRRSRADVSALGVQKFYDASSPYLALATAQGKAFQEIVLTVHKTNGGAHLDYLTITMTNATISLYEMANLGDEDPLEQISEHVEIEFEKIAIKYIVQADDHSAGAEHEVEYDVAAGV